jgi:hypothetical protein
MNSLILLIAVLFPVSDLSPAGPMHVQRSAINVPQLQEQSVDRELRVTASFSERRSVQPSEAIELVLSSALKDSDERLGILISNTDVSSLFSPLNLRLRYDAKLWPLPLGESTVTVYLVSNTGEWKELERFTLVVNNERTISRERSSLSSANDFEANFIRTSYFDRFASMLNPYLSLDDESTNRQEPPKTSSKPSGKKGKIKLVPSITLGMKSQPAQSTFPSSETPERATFADLTMQARLNNDATYGSFSSQSSADFAGSSFRQEALRFGDLGDTAPRVDLSSYLLKFQTGPVKYEVGHFSFGTQRHLINSFSSRGITITVPFLKHFDFSAAAMNGTQLVGYDNFFGLNRRRHQMLSGTLGLEIFPKRPGGLRLEVGALAAHFQPINGVNRGVITDQERSRGFSVRLIANDKGGRFQFQGGFTRSFFVNPPEETLNPDETVAAIPVLANNAHYLEASYQILKGFLLSKTRRANLTVAFREENVAPLFRSLGASTQADKIQYEFSVNGSVDEITGQFSYVNFHDNLKNIPSILRSLNGSMSLSLAAPAKTLLGRTKDSPWLPRLGYSFNRGHYFGAAIPVNGVFEIDLNSLPNLFGTVHTFSADWQINKFNIGYRLNRSLQDNQQIGRERADQGTLVNSGTVGVALNNKMTLDLVLSADSISSRESGEINRTYALGPAITWKLTRQMTVAGTFSNTIFNAIRLDAANGRKRNTEFDASWSYGFNAGTQELKKLSGQFSIRYSNHYSHSLDRLLSIDVLGKNQTLSANMSFTFF